MKKHWNKGAHRKAGKWYVFKVLHSLFCKRIRHFYVFFVVIQFGIAPEVINRTSHAVSEVEYDSDIEMIGSDSDFELDLTIEPNKQSTPKLPVEEDSEDTSFRPTMMNRVPITGATSTTAPALRPKATATPKPAAARLQKRRKVFKKPLQAHQKPLQQTLNHDGTLLKPKAVQVVVQQTLTNMWSRDKPSTSDTIDKKHVGKMRINPFNSQGKRKLMPITVSDSEASIHIFESKM